MMKMNKKKVPNKSLKMKKSSLLKRRLNKEKPLNIPFKT
jgi:hypothetical protein